MRKRNWKRLHPGSLRDALRLCQDYAREVRNLSIERIAERMGLADHWVLYKWIASGRMPAVSIPAYEAACGIDYVTRWLAARDGRLLVEIPTGRDASAGDMQALQEALTHAVGELLRFYAGAADADEVCGALMHGMEGLAWHRENVQRHAHPELDLGGEA